MGYASVWAHASSTTLATTRPICRVWLLASRDDLDEDLLVFALTDPMNLLTGVAAAVIVLPAIRGRGGVNRFMPCERQRPIIKYVACPADRTGRVSPRVPA